MTRRGRSLFLRLQEAQRRLLGRCSGGRKQLNVHHGLPTREWGWPGWRRGHRPDLHACQYDIPEGAGRLPAFAEATARSCRSSLLDARAASSGGKPESRCFWVQALPLRLLLTSSVPCPRSRRSTLRRTLLTLTCSRGCSTRRGSRRSCVEMTSSRFRAALSSGWRSGPRSGCSMTSAFPEPASSPTTSNVAQPRPPDHRRPGPAAAVRRSRSSSPRAGPAGGSGLVDKAWSFRMQETGGEGRPVPR